MNDERKDWIVESWISEWTYGWKNWDIVINMEEENEVQINGERVVLGLNWLYTNLMVEHSPVSFIE